MKWLAILSLGLLFGLLLWTALPVAFKTPPSRAEAVAGHYGIRNAVAAVVLGSRLWDTLMEILVFVVAMVGVRFGLAPLPRAEVGSSLADTHLLKEMFLLLFFPIAILAIYLAASGHLGPGGGFAAGAILGSGLLLLGLAIGVERVAGRLLRETYLERLEHSVVAVVLASGLAMALSGISTAWWFVAANLIIALEVAIGAWVVLHRFSAHRGEL